MEDVLFGIVLFRRPLLDPNHDSHQCFSNCGLQRFAIGPLVELQALQKLYETLSK
jgi:hypothetical protein